jgi:hypothetical protein
MPRVWEAIKEDRGKGTSKTNDVMKGSTRIKVYERSRERRPLLGRRVRNRYGNNFKESGESWPLYDRTQAYLLTTSQIGH